MDNDKLRKEYLISNEMFRFFIRKHWKDIEASNEECDELGLEFAKYLHELGLNEHQKESTIPKDESDVIMNMAHPFRMNGFPAAYMLHFTMFIEKMKKQHNG